MTLPERLVALHRAFSERRVPHAFGGAIALAYWTLDPRGTSDLDVNVFLPAADPERALVALPVGVDRPAGTAEAIGRDGQVRLWWDEMPVDLFFATIPFLETAAGRVRPAPFGGRRISILAAEDLAICKILFNREKDWLDLREMLLFGVGGMDLGYMCNWLGAMIGLADERVRRFDALVDTTRLE